MDTAFHFMPPGWSVDFRDGQYRAVWPTVQQGKGRGFEPSPTEMSEVQRDIGKLRPAGKKNKFLRRHGRGATSGGVCVALTYKAMMPEGMDVRVTPLVKEAEGDLPEVVSSRNAGRAPSSDSDDKVSVDSDVAGVASLAVAEVASSADFAGVAPPADLAGAYPADLAGAFPADLAKMAFPAIAGVASPVIPAVMAVRPLLE